MSQLTTYQERVVLGTQGMERYYISLETSPRLEPRKIKNILDAALHRMNFVFNTKARMCPKTSENESFPNKMLKKVATVPLIHRRPHPKRSWWSVACSDDSGDHGRPQKTAAAMEVIYAVNLTTTILHQNVRWHMLASSVIDFTLEHF